MMRGTRVELVSGPTPCEKVTVEQLKTGAIFQIDGSGPGWFRKAPVEDFTAARRRVTLLSSGDETCLPKETVVTRVAERVEIRIFG